jgi:hypothetical protein
MTVPGSANEGLMEDGLAETPLVLTPIGSSLRNLVDSARRDAPDVVAQNRGRSPGGTALARRRAVRLVRTRGAATGVTV